MGFETRFEADPSGAFPTQPVLSDRLRNYLVSRPEPNWEELTDEDLF